MTWPSGVAMQLTLRGIPFAGGRLNRGQYLEPAVRAGLLIDLLLAGRIEATDDAYTIDTERTGFGPADELLAGVDAHPDRTIEQWIGLGPDLVDAVLAEWVAIGVVNRSGHIRAHYTINRQLHRLTPYKPADTQVAACVTELTAVAGLPGLVISAHADGRCGNATWLIALTRAYLDDQRALYRREQATATSLWGG